MSKDDEIELDGVVVESLRGRFRVEIFPDGKASTPGKEVFVLAHLGGKLRKNFIRVVPGDKVRVAVSPYDLTKGRITYRHKD